MVAYHFSELENRLSLQMLRIIAAELRAVSGQADHSLQG